MSVCGHIFMYVSMHVCDRTLVLCIWLCVGIRSGLWRKTDRDYVSLYGFFNLPL